MHHLAITFTDDYMSIAHKDEHDEYFRRVYPYGHKFLEAHALGVFSQGAIESAVLYMLESISLERRIPTDIQIHSQKQREWLKKMVSTISCAQFYTETKKLHVTLDNKETHKKVYERYSQTIQSFKI